jgi:hypothetical protein
MYFIRYYVFDLLLYIYYVNIMIIIYNIILHNGEMITQIGYIGLI